MMTIDLAEKIRLLSDGELYDMAIDLVNRHHPSKVKVSDTQLNGLQNTLRSGNLKEVYLYIDNRLKRKTTSKSVKKFYKDLQVSLKNLHTLTTEPCDYLLVKEFIPHVVAEYNYQRSLSDA